MKSKDWIVLTLAIGICTALNIVTFAVLYDAIFSRASGLSDNAVQLLTGWGGGIVGVLGAYVGYRAGVSAANGKPTPAEPRSDTNGRESV